MAEQVQHPGTLIAIDGTRGKDVRAAARALAEALEDQHVECAISRFDASGLFGELAAGQADRNVSARTLTLVYAADLAFRLRWEIRPVLLAGGVVIAAPYTDTAAAFGVVAGLEEAWISRLLRFAPKPAYRARAEERKIDRGWKRRLDRGYAEYCAAMLEDATLDASWKQLRRKAMTLLDRPQGKKLYRLTGTGAVDLAQTIMGNRQDARRRSASTPRSARR